MKKTMLCIAVGILLFSMSACGNKTTEKEVADQFSNSVFIGDSITEGFTVNEILSKDCVIAGAGATAGYTYENIGALGEKQPDNIFIMLGSDDMLMPIDDPKGLFENDLTKLINKIKEVVPESNIYLESITPVTQEALEQESRYIHIDEYNELIKEVAENLSVHYVDLGAIAMEHPDLFAEDGIHFKKEFYMLWLKKLSEML
jgi:lysophospholipase L1-like esterase